MTNHQRLDPLSAAVHAQLIQMRIERFDQLRIVAIDPAANYPAQIPALNHQALDPLVEPPILEVEVGFQCVANIIGDIFLMVG